MKLVPFCILTALALVYAGLTLFATTVYRTWDRELTEQGQIQLKIAFMERRQEGTAQLLKRMAIESQHDPDFAQLLKQYHINVVLSPDAMQMFPGKHSPPSAPDNPGQPSPPSTPPSP